MMAGKELRHPQEIIEEIHARYKEINRRGAETARKLMFPEYVEKPVLPVAADQAPAPGAIVYRKTLKLLAETLNLSYPTLRKRMREDPAVGFPHLRGYGIHKTHALYRAAQSTKQKITREETRLEQKNSRRRSPGK